MKLTMLGSGNWEGSPSIFCKCKLCLQAIKVPNSVERRTRPGFYVSSGTSNLMMELSPDVKEQVGRYNIPETDHYLISHWHFDHLFGIYELHAWVELVRKKPIHIYCSQQTAAFIRKNIGHVPANLHVLEGFTPILIGDIRVTALPVYHMHDEDDSQKPKELNNTFGYLLEHGGKQVAYLADYYKVPDETLKLIEHANIVIADGTYLFEDDFPNLPYQQAIVAEKDPDHMHGQDIIQFVEQFKHAQIIYHSIGHLPGLSHARLQRKLAANQVIGWDGFEIAA